jgi:hypothetical protein
LSKGAYDKALSDTPTGYGFAKRVHSAIDGLFKKQDDKAKTAPSGIASGVISNKDQKKMQESVPAKKRGGSVKC